MDKDIFTFEDILNRDGRLVYTNVGVSMMPLIREGKDVLLIEKCDTEMLKKYDVVLFRREGINGRGEYVLHRIIKILPEGKFFIAGDNCTDGETVDGEMILGVLKTVNRNNKAVDFNGLKYRLYVRLWCAPYRIRFSLLKIKEAFKEAKRVAANKLKKH